MTDAEPFTAANPGIDVGDAKQVRAQKRHARNRDQAFLHSLDVVLSSTEGRKFVWHLISGNDLDGAGVMEDPFVGDALVTAYRAGRQSFGKKLMAELMKPERVRVYAQIVDENAT